ncbi:MAG TPA: hypothetical protein PLC42_00995, partial [Parachlamydiaceae bacterium]|nr:hypothetical protein [Parachlamydiaceae bacterium]
MNKQDITKNIVLAIQKLELFSDALVKKKLTPLEETVHLVRSFMNRKQKKTNDVQEAIEVIQKNFLFIQKLKKGNSAEKSLADASIKAVLRYNETVNPSFKPVEFDGFKKTSRINQRISQFMYKKWGFSAEQEAEKKLIHLPFEASAEFIYCQNPKETYKISQTTLSSIQGDESVLQEEADAFRMKIISLLKAEGFTPMGDEVRRSPIIASLHSEDLKKILISQIVKSFPGEVFTFKGTFQRSYEAFLKS